MKRIFTFGLMLASVFALTNCTEELVDPTIPNDEVTQETTTPEGEGIPFQIYASLGTETKTVGSVSADGTLKTAWESGDQINVFHKVSDAAAYVDDGLFTVADIKNGLFDGELQEELDPNKLYNWYFVYVEDQSGKATDLEKEQLTAIPMTFNVEPKEISQVSGVNCPMYGTIKNLSGAVTPRMQLKHMTSLIELTIVNNTAAKDYHSWGWTGGAITLTDVKMSSSSALTNSSLTADITRDQLSFASNGGTDSKELVAVSSTKAVAKGASSKFYFIVSPSASKPHTLNFTINGISRSVTKTLAFEAGKVTKFTVPINDLKHPHTSDAFDFKSTGSATAGTQILQLGSKTDATATINGQANVPIYIVGNGSKGTITITGSTKDIINALDVGFYASTWPGAPSAMTLSNINLWISGTQVASYQPLLDAMKKIIDDILNPNDDLLGGIAAGGAWLIGKPVIQGMLNKGIPRDGALLALTKFIDPQTITFNGVIANGASNDHKDIFVLHEEHKYKGINKELIDKFLGDNSTSMGGKFIYNGIKPTYQGLKDIVNGTTSATDNINNNGKTFAENTSYAIYNKLLNTIGTRSFNLTDDIKVPFSDVFNAVFASEADMVAKLPNVEVQITVASCDYYAKKATYATKNSEGNYQYTLENLQTNKNPLIFWGLDAYGANDETKPIN